MANFYISGTWQTANRITDVMLHSAASDGGYTVGRKTSEQAVINLINQGNAVYTIMWNYNNGSWTIGARVIVVQEYGRNILRTNPNTTVRDNLDNLIRMEYFF
jgi:hypothetical protein